MKVGAKISLKGTRPLLIHAFPLSGLDSNKSKSGSAGKNADEWKDTSLIHPKTRHLFFYGSYILGTIKEGGKYIKVGKGSLAKKIQATLECADDQIIIKNRIAPEEKNMPIGDSTENVYIDIRSVVNPMTKGRNLRYRLAAKAGWECSTTVYWDDFAISKEQAKHAIELAGSLVGIGDGRTIGFGRFELMEFDMLD